MLTIFNTDQIKKLQQIGSSEHDFCILWVPRRTLVAEAILEENSVLGDVISLELPIYFHGIDSDLLSLELEDSFSDLYLVSIDAVQMRIMLTHSQLSVTTPHVSSRLPKL